MHQTGNQPKGVRLPIALCGRKQAQAHGRTCTRLRRRPEEKKIEDSAENVEPPAGEEEVACMDDSRSISLGGQEAQDLAHDAPA
jgi:hypothetical protein